MTTEARLPLIAVHGFMYDPKDVGGSNDPAPFFEEMSGITGREVTPFAWYSAPFGLRAARPFHSTYQTLRAWLGSWASGKAHPYRLAWALASKAAGDLTVTIQNTPGPVDLVAHSLGVRVALKALWALPPGKVRRVIFFNGAELERNARDVYTWQPALANSALSSALVLNIAVRADDVLKHLGANFSGDDDGPCVGRIGLRDHPPTWRDLFLDSIAMRTRAKQRRGWILRGDAPNDFMDHSESYSFAGNVDLVRAWLAGDELTDLVGVR